MVTSRKIKALNRDIAKIEIEIEELNEELQRHKEKMQMGKITKAQFQKARINLSDKMRGLNGAINRKKKARQMIEDDIKEKEEEKEKEAL
jgi:multidrug resistance efflux pump